MKKLQNNFTTPEQSKRLLELGLPADSADMLWDGTYDLENGWEFEDYPTYSDKKYSYYQGLYREEDVVNILPCWSVGRLMEIFQVVCPYEYYNAIEQATACNNSPADWVYNFQTYHDRLDFSKLEED